MDTFWTVLLGLIALAWLMGAIALISGMARLPRLARVKQLPDADCPSVSILVAGRNEQEKLPGALPTLLAQDYPNYEVVFVNDRSTDATPNILDQFADKHSNLKVIHVDQLPPGWLGKPHGFWTAYQHATGDWLVFTDADVRFAPDVLRRSLALVKQKGWDHLTLAGRIDLEGFWEKIIVSYFLLVFLLNTRAWTVSNPRSRAYVGVGSFQLLRRSAYEAIGTHRRLALEVVDDIKLGKLVKQGGFHSGMAIAEDSIRLRWQEGVGNIIRGLTKNTFAYFRYGLGQTLWSVVITFALSLLPFLALVVLSGPPRLLAGAAVFAAIGLQGATAFGSRVSPLYALTHPLGATLIIYITLRSAVVTLWRDTFYPLDELRKGSV